MTPLDARTVSELVGSVRHRLRRVAGGVLALGALGVVAAVLVLAWLFAGDTGWSPGTPVPLLLLIGGVVAVLALCGWMIPQVGRWTTDERLSDEMERSASLPEGSVRAQVEFARGVPSGVSASLVQAGERTLLARITDRADRLAGEPGRRLGRMARIATVGAVVTALLAGSVAFASPNRARAAWAGLARPGALLAAPTLPPLRLAPGDAEIPRGEAPRVLVEAEGRDSVTVHWQGVGDVLRERRIEVVGAAAETALPPLDVSVRYWASSADGARTGEASFIPVDPSMLSGLALQVTYPAHTRLPAEFFRAFPAWLRVPTGSVLEVSGRVGGGGEEVRLALPNGDAVMRSQVSDGTFVGSWEPDRSVRLEWEMAGAREAGILPPPFEVELVPDASPEIGLEVVAGVPEIPLSYRVPVQVSASDDYGVRWVEIETLLRRPGESDEPVLDRISTDERVDVSLRPTLDFSGWGLRPGDEILVLARASDNSPAVQIAETPYLRLVMPRSSEVRDAARDRIEDAADRADDLLDRVSDDTDELRDLERRAELASEGSSGRGDRSQGFENREELRQAAERQAQAANEIDEIRSALNEASRALGELASGDPQDQELRERIEQLEQLLDDVLGPDALERLDGLREELTQGDTPRSESEVVQELADTQEELRAQLERALERLEQAEVDEAFRGAEEEIESLLETQQGLTEELADGRGQELQAEQAERTRALENQLSELEQTLTERGDERGAERTNSAADDVQDASQSMDRAAEASRSDDPESATDQAEQAANQLEQALQELQENRQETAGSAEERMQAGLRQGAQDALSLARRQAEIRDRLESGGAQDPSDLEPEAAAVLEGLRNLASGLSEATQSDADLSRDLSEALGQSLEAVQEMVDAIRQEPGGQTDPGGAAEAGQAALNELAMQAIAGAGRGNNPDGEPSPGSQPADDLASLSAEQDALNQQTSQAAQQSSPDGRPTPQQLEDMTESERGIASILREMAERQAPGPSRRNLEALADEGDDIAEALSQGRLDGTTVDRQEQFLQRLLDAGRTLERDGPTDEREAITAEAIGRRAVTAIPENILETMALPLPSLEALEALEPAQRRWVLDYFDRVNRRRASEVEP